MPVNRIFKFQDIFEVQAFLNGAIVGGNVGGGVAGLVGQTLTFTSPAFAITFKPVSPAPLTRDPYTLLFQDIKQQIEAGSTQILVQQVGGRILFIEKAPASGVALSPNNEPAKALLGFDQTGPVIGKFYKPATVAGATPPFYEWAYSVNETTHVVFTWE
jgi:hypothetical protein